MKIKLNFELIYNFFIKVFIYMLNAFGNFMRQIPGK